MSKKEETPKEEKKSKGVEIEVGEPLELKPKELPLVVKPKGGDWANEAQAEFARTLNGYAYRNPEKWDAKKEKLLKQLETLGKDPSQYQAITGTVLGDTSLSYTNKLIDQ